jgi:TPP-dependent pyruvate/acetoin dehydrogenase alpha subunit
LRDRALKESLATEQDFKKIDREIERVIQDCAEFALASPQPDVSTALDHVFSN